MVSLRYWLRRSHRCCSQDSKYDLRAPGSSFTIVEILIVVVIIAIAAMVAIPMMSSGGSMQIRSAANMIAADLEYAKSMAIGRQQNYAVVFDAAGESYEIKDYNSVSSSWEVIDHPVKKGFQYVMNFNNDSRLSKVDIAAVDFGGTSQIEFDYLGSPINGGGTVSLQAGGTTITINVEPVTGFISITD